SLKRSIPPSSRAPGSGFDRAHHHRDLRRQDLGGQRRRRRRRVSLYPAAGRAPSGMTPETPVIHVVDDVAAFRAAVARLLRASGYQVALYESAARLLETPPGNEAGCILLDVRMPGLSGPELQARLAETGNPLPIVFLTGHGDVPTG